MNKQIKKQLAPLCILVSVIIFAAVLFFTVKPLFESFSEAKTQRENAEREEKDSKKEPGSAFQVHMQIQRLGR